MADFPAAITIQVKSREALQKIVEIEKKLADVVRDYEIGITKVSKSYEKIVAQTKLIASSQKEVNRELLRAAKIQQTIQNTRSARIARENNQRATNQSGGLGPGLPPGRIVGPTQDFAGQAAEAARRTAIADARQLVTLRLAEARALRAQGGIQQGLNNLNKAQLEVARDISQAKGEQIRQDRIAVRFAEREAAAKKRSAAEGKKALATSQASAKAAASSAKAAEREAAAKKKANASAIGNRAQNVALGVGFPLLFGGGPGAIAGGGLGAIGGGFGGSVIASGLGAQFDQLIQSATELGQALNPLTADLDKIVEASGAAGTSLGGIVSELESLGLSTAAYTSALQILENQIGEDGVKALREFGDGTADLGREVQKLLTDVSVVIAEQLTPAVQGLVGALANANLERQGSRLAQTDTPLGEQLRGIRDRVQGGEITPAQGLEEQRQLLIKFNDERARGVDEAARAEKLLDAQVQASLRSYEAQNDALRSRQEQDEKTTKEKEKQAELDKKAADRAAKAAAREAERARREEERLQKQIQGRVVDAAATQELIRLDNLESQARIDRDKFAQIEIQRDKELLALAQQRQKALIGITDERLKAAIAADFDARESRVRNNATNKAGELVVSNGRAADDQFLALQNQLQLVTALTDEEKRRVKLAQDLATIQKNDAGLADGDVERLKAATIALSEGEAAAERYNQVLQSTQEIAGALSNSVLNGIRAVVEGTATAEEAFASFLNTIVDLLLKAAAEQIATYIAIGIARQFAGMGGGTGQGSQGFGAGSPNLGAIVGIGPIRRGVGGPVSGGSSYIVGENGPELFIPGKTGSIVPTDVFAATQAAMISSESDKISDDDTAYADQETTAFASNAASLAAAQNTYNQSNATNNASSQNSQLLQNAYAQNSQLLQNAYTQNGGALSSSANTYTTNKYAAAAMQSETSAGAMTVSVDSTVINRQEYVTIDQFSEGMRKTANQARAKVFSDLKNKPGRRKGLGL